MTSSRETTSAHALLRARLCFVGLCASLSGCASTPSSHNDVAHPAAGPVSMPTTVEALAATDLSWLSTAVLACGVAALLAYLFRAHLPFNGVTSKVLLAAAVTFAIIRYVLVIVTPFLYTTLVIAGLCVATYYAITRGAIVYATLRDAIREWYARPRQ